MEKRIMLGEALRYGWDTFKRLGGPLFGFSFAYIVGYLVLAYFLHRLSSGLPGILLSQLLQGTQTVALTAFCLSVFDTGRASFQEASGYLSWKKYGKVILGNLLYSLIVLTGIILLIVPGIIWGLQFGLYSYLIIDQDLGVVDAFKESARLTKGVKADLFAFGFVVWGLMMLGIVAFGVGMLVAFPVVSLASVSIYRRLGMVEAPPLQSA